MKCAFPGPQWLRTMLSLFKAEKNSAEAKHFVVAGPGYCDINEMHIMTTATEFE